MRNYTIKLRDGSIIIAEKSFWDLMDDSGDWKYFRNVQGRDAPAMNKKDRLIIPRESILYVVRERR